MRYRAALPMYDLPELRAETDRFWRRLKSALPHGTEVVFERPATHAEMVALLADRSCILSQTCWGPISQGLLPDLTILAQPDYSPFPGGDGPLYRSAIIATGTGDDAPPPKKGALIPTQALSGKRLAYNEPASLSGYISLQRDTEMPFSQEILTGSHRASLCAVAQGDADIAAIDNQTFALLRAHEPLAKKVHVIGWTAPRMGLPYVANPAAPAPLTNAIRAALLAAGAHPPGDSPPIL